MAELQINKLTIDLDKVADASEEEYQGYLYYARQWDAPQTPEWVAKLQQARGEKAASPDAPQTTSSGDDVLDYSELTVEELEEELKNRDLPSSGRKQELIDRLEEDDKS